MRVAEQLRAATDAALATGKTRYEIAKGAGIKYSTLANWLDEDRDIRLSTVSALAEYLRLELKPRESKRGR